jgi:anti-sigma regulatory factor (Ser/Thr protein kinase)
MTSPDPPGGGGRGRKPLAPPVAVPLDLVVDADGLYAMRASVLAHAASMGASARATERLLIVASELVTNAIRHGGGRGRLRLWSDSMHLHCEITDDGPGIDDPEAGTKRPDPAALGGRGLWIARQLSDDVLVSTGPQGTVVTATVSLDRSRDTP